MKRKNLNIHILILCTALFLLFLIASMPEAHDCTGEDCPVCLFCSIIRGIAALSGLMHCAYRVSISVDGCIRAHGGRERAPMCVSLFERRTLLLD